MLGNNFVKTMIRLAGERSELRVVADQWGSPTSTSSLAEALLNLIECHASGIVHYSNDGSCSWHAFTQQIVERAHAFGLIPRIPLVHAIKTSEYPTLAQRPAYSVLDGTKYTQLTKKTRISWKNALDEILILLKQDLSL